MATPTVMDTTITKKRSSNMKEVVYNQREYAVADVVEAIMSVLLLHKRSHPPLSRRLS